MGYTGAILFIDLSSERIWTISTNEYSGLFVGGRGIATRILYEHPNALVFMTGPLTGYVPSGSRMDVVGMSPISGMIGGSSVGGDFPVALKLAGYDGIVILGKSNNPVSIVIDNDEVDIRNAHEIWGLNGFETIKTIKKDYPKAEVACIGRAGENKVRYAGILFSERNMASRSGLGAVMGVKKVKAIIVCGSKSLKPRNPSGLLSSFGKILKSIIESDENMRFKNWHKQFVPTILRLKMPYFGDYETWWNEACEAAIAATRFFEENTVARSSCFSCPLRCKAIISLDGENVPINLCQGTIPAIMFILKIKDPYLAWRIYVKCQSEGLDIMSTCAVLAFASRLGIVRLGTPEILGLIEKIIERKDEGEVLADGIYHASRRYNVEAVYMKGGLESWSSDIRPFIGSALISMVSDSGGVNRALYGFPEFYYYLKSEKAKKVAEKFVKDPEAAYPWSYSENKVKFAVIWENLHIIADILGVCVIAFLTTPLSLWVEAYNYTTGHNISENDLLIAAERTRTLERLFNTKFSKVTDTLSPRLFRGKSGIDKEKIEEMKRIYYKIRGWDVNGVPTDETISRLGLNDLK